MRFAFTNFDNRVGLFVSKYASVPIIFGEETPLQEGNLIPPLSRYSDAGDGSMLGGSDFLIQVDEGASYQWTRDGNDLTIVNGDLREISLSGPLTAKTYLVKAVPTAADMALWGAAPTDPLTSVVMDGVTLHSGDVFAITSFSNHAYNGVFKLTSDGGAYAVQELAFPGMSIHVVEGASNAGKNFYCTSSANDSSLATTWAELPAGKAMFRLTGSPGVLITASLTRIP
jgi:hypothetical protein